MCEFLSFDVCARVRACPCVHACSRTWTLPILFLLSIRININNVFLTVSGLCDSTGGGSELSASMDR